MTYEPEQAGHLTPEILQRAFNELWDPRPTLEMEAQRRFYELQGLEAKWDQPLQRIDHDPFGNVVWLNELAERWNLVLKP